MGYCVPVTGVGADDGMVWPVIGVRDDTTGGADAWRAAMPGVSGVGAPTTVGLEALAPAQGAGRKLSRR